MRFLYRTLSNLIYPFLIILIFLRKIFKKEDSKRYKEKLFPHSFNVNKDKNSRLIWFHTASIGELKSILPIIEELDKQKNINFEFLVTTITVSSANLAKKELVRFKNAKHRFFPLDINFLIKKFLNLWKPEAIILVDSEIWPNLIFLAKDRKIPMAIINARITKKTFKRWMMFPKIAKSIFGIFELCLVSNPETKKFLENLNAKNIFSFGNLKFCETYNESKLLNINKEFLTTNKFWLAASTHDGEDDFCVQTHLELKKESKNIKTIIAPRHISRVKKIKRISENFNLNCQILNKNDKILDNNEIIIINYFGSLPSYYKYSQSVFVGKSILKKFQQVGGQNPIEAAKLGCKIYHGPYVYNFQDIYSLLAKNEVSKQINSKEELVKNLAIDLKNSKNDNLEFITLVNLLGKRILIDSIRKINTFLDEIK